MVKNQTYANGLPCSLYVGYVSLQNLDRAHILPVPVPVSLDHIRYLFMQVTITAFHDKHRYRIKGLLYTVERMTINGRYRCTN